MLSLFVAGKVTDFVFPRNISKILNCNFKVEKKTKELNLVKNVSKTEFEATFSGKELLIVKLPNELLYCKMLPVYAFPKFPKKFRKITL